jgi:hypothetical protein
MIEVEEQQLLSIELSNKNGDYHGFSNFKIALKCTVVFD